MLKLEPTVADVGIFKIVPLPWRYDKSTGNILDFYGRVVANNKQTHEVGESIVKVFNNLAIKIKSK